MICRAVIGLLHLVADRGTQVELTCGRWGWWIRLASVVLSGRANRPQEQMGCWFLPIRCRWSHSFNLEDGDRWPSEEEPMLEDDHDDDARLWDGGRRCRAVRARSTSSFNPVSSGIVIQVWVALHESSRGARGEQIGVVQKHEGQCSEDQERNGKW